MYTLSVSTAFTAYHFLIDGDWGPENDRHAHQYRVEVVVKGETLDRHGYLVDITDVEHRLAVLKQRYENATLNEQPEFAGLNPSIEHFSRIVWESLVRDTAALDPERIREVRVRVWENDIAAASYAGALG
jgi:6-pyruvoyltetrahydropterin/6-carboxytetrahydropterin synthase